MACLRLLRNSCPRAPPEFKRAEESHDQDNQEIDYDEEQQDQDDLENSNLQVLRFFKLQVSFQNK